MQAFDYGDRVGARYLAFVAPDEWDKGMVRIKSLRATTLDEIGQGQPGVVGAAGEDGGKQVDVPWKGMEKAIKSMLKSAFV